MTIKWWQLIVVGLVIFLVGIGTGYILHKPNPASTIAPTTVVFGKPDTTHVATQPIIGSHNYPHVHSDSSQHAGSVAPRAIFSYTKTTDSTQNGIHFVFRSTTYPYPDSLGNPTDSAYIVHEWNIQPLPMNTIFRTDTVRTMVPVPVPTPVPFYAKPSVVFPVGVAIGVAITVFIIKNVR